MDPSDLARTIRQAKGEVLRDVRDGSVPATVKSFSELHDHVDANYYGGAFDRWADNEGEDDEDAVDNACRFWNAVQDAVHAWIRAGDMLRDLASGETYGLGDDAEDEAAAVPSVPRPGLAADPGLGDPDVSAEPTYVLVGGPPG